MATRRQLLESARTQLEDANVPANYKEIKWLLLEAEKISSIDLITNPDSVVDGAVEDRFTSFIARRRQREPVQYILGYTEFYGLRFSVDPSVLIPRPESELLVERTLSLVEDKAEACVVDVGTGSGCIAIAVKKMKPDTRVTGVDISSRALETARKNARDLHADVTWLEADFSNLRLVEHIVSVHGSRRIDVLVSNPPYISPDEQCTLEPEVFEYEPTEALFTADDPLEPFRALATLGSNVLSKGGTLLLEIHEQRAKPVMMILLQTGFQDIAVEKDLAGRDRMVSARIRL